MIRGTSSHAFVSPWAIARRTPRSGTTCAGDGRRRDQRSAQRPGDGRAARSTSSRTIRPCGPLPATAARSTPSSRASRRVAGAASGASGRHRRAPTGRREFPIGRSPIAELPTDVRGLCPSSSAIAELPTGERGLCPSRRRVGASCRRRRWPTPLPPPRCPPPPRPAAAPRRSPGTGSRRSPCRSGSRRGPGPRGTWSPSATRQATMSAVGDPLADVGQAELDDATVRPPATARTAASTRSTDGT